MDKTERFDNQARTHDAKQRINAYSPRDYFEALRASPHPRTDYENAKLRAEIERRYASRERRRLADPLRFMTLIRLDELERMLLDHYGLYLPDDDSGWDDFTVVAHHLAHLGNTIKVIARIVEWAEIWAPDFPTDKVIDRAKLVAANPMKWKADTLARKLRLSMVQRTRLKIATIGAFDVKREDRPAWLSEYHRQRKEADRRAKGVKTRAEYLATNSDSAKKPWLALGMSKATWHRKGKPMPEMEPAFESGPADQSKHHRETGPADYKDRIRAAGLVSSTTATSHDRPTARMDRKGLSNGSVSLDLPPQATGTVFVEANKQTSLEALGRIVMRNGKICVNGIAQGDGIIVITMDDDSEEEEMTQRDDDFVDPGEDFWRLRVVGIDAPPPRTPDAPPQPTWEEIHAEIMARAARQPTREEVRAAIIEEAKKIASAPIPAGVPPWKPWQSSEACDYSGAASPLTKSSAPATKKAASGDDPRYAWLKHNWPFEEDKVPF